MAGLLLSKGTLSTGYPFTLDDRTAQGGEFSGPLTIDVHSGTSANGPPIVSFYFTEDFVAIPDQSILQGPAGGFQIEVPKSIDLTNWYPVLIQYTSSDQKSFYRMKLSK
jgi:hypothetical protein